jgi:hypothetical protein
MKALFAQLRRPVFKTSASEKVFIAAAAAFLGELNAIHAFREAMVGRSLRFASDLGARWSSVRPHWFATKTVSGRHD